MTTANVKRTFFVLCCNFILYFFLNCGIIVAAAEEEPPGNAPELRENLEWLNTDHPLQLKDLRGKFVLLDFWTYCCINCMHIIPDLKALEEKYPAELVVIGVHSAKFTTEQGSENIREAILRYGIEHPVVNDRQLLIWRDYDIHAWPTVILIDPLGNIIGRKSGEEIFNPIDQVLTRAIKRFENSIDREPLTFALEKFKKKEALLDFPGKIVADSKKERLYIADSGHNRILEVDPIGQILQTIGTGEAGQLDGAFNEAQFSNPQGLVVDGSLLYVADTDNHLIRRVDLEKKMVSTLAGIGIKGTPTNPDGRLDQVPLNSPWDLIILQNNLYIAMTGAHQIWKLDLTKEKIFIHAGSGSENLKDGTNRAAHLAQPSGITSDGEKIYFADSEVSAVRSSELSARGNVQTLIGQGLFEFGDVDGNLDSARLQHPLGLIYLNKLLYVADTYNNKIKVVDPVNATSRTFAGSGKAGLVDGDLNSAQFNEPAGLAYLNEILYVADTNNHAIRSIDFKSGTVSTLNLKLILTPSREERFDAQEFSGDQISLPEEYSNVVDELQLKFNLPPEHKFLETAPAALNLYSKEGDLISKFEIKKLEDVYTINQEIHSDGLYAEAVVYYCREGEEALCLVRNVLFEIPLKPDALSHTINLQFDVPVNPL